MKKYFIAGDIHSFFEFWKEALDEKGFDVNNDSHILVVLGDLFDRGRESKECLDFVVSLPKERTVLIRGNHETLLEDLLESKRGVSYYDYTNGTVQTILDLSTKSGLVDLFEDIVDVSNNEKLKEYYSRLVWFYEPDEHNVFCHGWLPIMDYTLDEEELAVADDDLCYIPHNWRTFPEKEWDKASWRNGMALWDEGARLEGTTIWCGHWHTSWGHYHLHAAGSEFGDDACFDPFVDEGIVALDGCTAYSHQVNVMTLEVDE